jgi:hypothetical protein
LNIFCLFVCTERISRLNFYWKMLLRFSDSCHWDSAVIDFVLWACNRLIRRSRRPLGTLRNLRGTTTTEKCRIQRLSKTLKKWFEKSKRLFWKFLMVSRSQFLRFVSLWMEKFQYKNLQLTITQHICRMHMFTWQFFQF